MRKHKLTKIYRPIVSTITFLINTFGLVLSILGAFHSPNNYTEQKYVLFLLITAEIFLIISVIYSVVSIINSYHSKESIDEKNIELRKHKESNKIIYENNKNIITLYKDSYNRLHMLRNKHDDEFEIISKLREKENNELTTTIKELNTNMINNYKNSLLEQYDYFMTNVLNYLKVSIEKYLSTKGCSASISLAMKQLEEPEKYSEIDDSKKNIYTAFRDATTYNSKTRNETWNKTFCIAKNSDFRLSIEKDYYIFNYMNKIYMDNGLYLNENTNFYEHYNSGVTCTIYSCIEEERILYGFLACDALFGSEEEKKCGKQIFDYCVANIMMASAHIIALFLANFLTTWKKCYIEHYNNLLKESDEYKKKNMCRTMMDTVTRTRYMN